MDRLYEQYNEVFPMEIYSKDIYTGNAESLYYITPIPIAAPHYTIYRVTDGDIIYDSDDWDDNVMYYQSAVSEQQSGKGGIYYMKDDRDNEMPIDFKNRLVSGKYIITTGTSDATLSVAHSNKIGQAATSTLYVLGSIDVGSGHTFRNNTIGTVQGVNVFNGSAYDNSFLELLGNNSFTGDVYSNTVGAGFQNNTFVGKFYNSTIGGGCTDNTFDDVAGSSSKLSISNSTIGNNVTGNNFGRLVNCTLGNYIKNCKFGFTVGAFFQGVNENLSLVNSSGVTVNYTRQWVFRSGAKGYTLVYDGTTSSNDPLLNITLGARSNKDTSIISVEIPKSTKGENYTVAVNSSGSPVVYCEADLFQTIS